MQSITFFSLILGLLAILGILAVVYISSSGSNPHIPEIIIGTIAIGLFIGISSTLIHTLFEKQISAKPIISTLLALFCLAILVAILVYSSNNPKNIRREIPVTYLVDIKTNEMPFGLQFHSTTTHVCYDDARFIFKNFKEKSSENSKRIIEMVTSSGVDTSGFSIRFFQNLTEYLIPYFIGNRFVTPEAELTRYYRETPKWLGMPDNKIKGKSMSLEYITGEFKDNLFYGIKGQIPDNKIEMILPKDTEITLKRDDGPTSRFIIKNKFLEIKIGVRYLIGTSEFFAFLHPSAIPPYSPSAKELKRSFKRYDTIIYYDVNFNKWRYGFPIMRYYEEWANSLISVMQRKFAWGSSVLVDPLEVLRYYEGIKK